jgi:hypothetical protein
LVPRDGITGSEPGASGTGSHRTTSIRRRRQFKNTRTTSGGGAGFDDGNDSIIDALNAGDHVAPLIGISGTGLVLLAGMWWLYFSSDSAGELTTFSGVLIWGYGLT